VATTRVLRIVNESSYEPPHGDATLRSIARAITVQLRDVASAWGGAVWQVVDDAHHRGFRIVLKDNDGAAQDDGYHDLDSHDRPYAMVFMDPILKHKGKQKGTWLRGTNSVSATVSHEACEFVVDPATNRWAQSARNSMWSLEVCDPVENFAYNVTLRDGSRVAVSDFVTPAWFDPLAERRERFDWMRKLHWPFEIAPDGYAIRYSGGRMRNIWGPEYPAWMKRTKRVCGSRTWKRHTFGGPCD
jgi:hypothetical protein